MSADFYKEFEGRFRGSRELIKDRLRVYLPFIDPLKDLYPGEAILDLGCGRGEWLELMNDCGFSVTGVDLDPKMLESCSHLGFKTIEGDAIEFLKSLPEDSCAAISAFHLIEHIGFEQLQVIIRESLRVLKPAGLLILETPNAENIIVGTQNFYLDPTHIKPIPSLQLSFLMDFCGFSRSKILGLQSENFSHIPKCIPSLQRAIKGVSNDYSVVAQKRGGDNLMSKFDRAWSLEYGVGLGKSFADFDAAMIQQREELDLLKSVHAELKAVYSSSSWRITAPMRKLSDVLRSLNSKLRTAYRFLRSMPRRIFKVAAIFAVSTPRRRYFVEKLLKALGLQGWAQARLAKMRDGYDVLGTQNAPPWIPNAFMSAQAETFFSQLELEIKGRGEDK